jgi:hypothetical protein
MKRVSGRVGESLAGEDGRGAVRAGDLRPRASATGLSVGAEGVVGVGRWLRASAPEFPIGAAGWGGWLEE